MKIAVSAKVPNLEAEVDPRFGRCRCLLIVDTDTMKFEAVDNDSIAASGGAGIAAAQAVLNYDVQAVITGNLGPNAHQVLSQAGVKVFTGVSGKVWNAVETFKAGGLQETTGPTVEAHAGMTVPPRQSSSVPSAMTSEIETLKGRANTMRQQLDNLVFRIEELERKAA